MLWEKVVQHKGDDDTNSTGTVLKSLQIRLGELKIRGRMKIIQNTLDSPEHIRIIAVTETSVKKKKKLKHILGEYWNFTIN